MNTLWKSGAAITLSIVVVGCGSIDTEAFADHGTSSEGGAIEDLERDGAIDEDDAAIPEDSSTPVDAAPGKDSSPPRDSKPPSDTTSPPVDSGGPLDTVCARYADAICTPTTAKCCTPHGVEYAEAGCRRDVASWCSALVEQVRGGERAFDATKVDACLTAWRTLTSRCSLPTLEYVSTYAPCGLVFNGSTPLGGECTADDECHAEPGGWANCTDTPGTCENVFVVGKDAPCSYTGTTRPYCSAGLYCPYTGSPSTCRVAKALGTACSGTSDVACGFGRSCSSAGSGGYKCTEGLPAGASCSSNLQCASWGCDGGHCTDPNVHLANSALCNGT
jgi:hypothetical protein